MYWYNNGKCALLSFYMSGVENGFLKTLDLMLHKIFMILSVLSRQMCGNWNMSLSFEGCEYWSYWVILISFLCFQLVDSDSGPAKPTSGAFFVQWHHLVLIPPLALVYPPKTPDREGKCPPLTEENNGNPFDPFDLLLCS